ncbi:AbrB/MazE/SpoVT family DNA-binding domain-containing protein [Halorientalis brevis]|uniref:AbrB/MazE/SpoVT family DNA-binding domain-containing protein n=1 Tax=Halorientalis brevis TaxID=1126241 RepID=A0ABD6CAU6_9EURY|nr:AbrB/MazE/SpoVT family DNA-binding domain-containing protein [Halorientalis brevis]
MSDDHNGSALLPALLANKLQEAGESAIDTQQQALAQLLGQAQSPTDFPLEALQETATFKTRVQSSGRISIPDAERQVLGIEENDIVQAIIVPLDRKEGNDNE